MQRVLLTLAVMALAVVTVSPASAQEAPKPGPEHELLKKFVGEWDATVNFMGNESKAKMTAKVILGGFWLATEFDGEFAGMKFQGRGTNGYDPLKKKYVSSWIDSMSPSLMVMEGSFDKDGKVYTERGEGPGPDGKLSKMKSVQEFKDDDNITMTMYQEVEGKEQEMFKIVYKRKKA